LQNAAHKDYASAQFNLGRVLANGIVASPDPETAIVWFEKAAEKGLDEAHFQLAIMIARGVGIEANQAKATEHLRAAAEKNHVQAQYALGRTLLRGRGVSPDPHEALIWLERSAYSGNHRAQARLAEVYIKGLDVAQDRPRGCAWLTLAAGQRPRRYLQTMSTLKDSLSPDENALAVNVLQELRRVFSTRGDGSEGNMREAQWPRTLTTQATTQERHRTESPMRSLKPLNR
jgi:TPR repeat protein